MKILIFIKTSLLLAFIALFFSFDFSYNCFEAFLSLSKHDCHQEYRWKVKLMEDEDAPNVMLKPTKKYTKISDLQDIEYFYPKFQSNRYTEEFLTVMFKFRIKEYKEENGTKGDNDYHVVLQDIYL